MEDALLILLIFSNLAWYFYSKNSVKFLYAKSIVERKVVNIQVSQQDDVFYFHDLVTGMFITQSKDYNQAVRNLTEQFKGSIIIISVLAEKIDG